jgi:3-methyladenine DNA glycosylase AlkC
MVGGKENSSLVLEVCARWARTGDPNTLWIVKHGLKKLEATHPDAVAKILLQAPTTATAASKAPAAKKPAVKADRTR